MPWLEQKGDSRSQLKKKHLLGLANYLTYGRIAVIPVFLILLPMVHPADLAPTGWDITISWFTTILFIITGLSDVVDGYLARRGESTGAFGKFLDPLADKLIMAAVLIMLVPLERVNAWVVVILISREIAVTAVRGMAISEGIVIAASNWGKKKTVICNFALGALLVHYPFLGIDPHVIGMVWLAVTMAVSVGSGLHYVWSFFREVFARAKST